MNNTVKINIQAINNTSAGMKGVIGSFTELNSALSLGKQALAYLEQGFQATVGKLIDYGTQVEDLSRVTGMSADETSRLIQVADDLFVEFGSLKMAAKQLAADGMIPNIETMAALSDKYLSFTSDTERAQWATKEFGRNYAEMTKLLEAGGDAIREAAAGQPGGLILSEEDLANVKAYKQSVDGLNDTLAAMAMTIGKAVIPGVVSFINRTRDNIAAVEDLGNAIKNSRLKIEWVNGALNIGSPEALEKYKLDASGATAATEALTRAYTEQARIVADELLEADKADAEAKAELMRQIEGLDGAERIYHDGLLDQIAVQQQANVTITEAAWGAAEAAVSIGKDLAGAYASLQAAQQAWNTTVGEDAAASLKAMGADAQTTSQGLAIIDGVFGTNTLAREQYKLAMEAINAEFLKTGDAELYREKLGELANDFEYSLAPGIKVAEDAVARLQAALDTLSGQHITTTVDVIINTINNAGGGGGGSSTTTGTGGSGTGEPTLPGLPTPTWGGGGNVIIVTKDEKSAAIAGATASAYQRKAVSVRMGG